jgi:hypothetical protein
MANISTLPKSGIVSGAELELAMVEVASAERDFPLVVTGKSHKRSLRNKYHDLAVYLGDRRVRNLATRAALA